MKNQFFKDDLVITHKFHVLNEGAQEQIPVPEHVRITYFTEPNSGFIRIERNGDNFTGCSLSTDGMTLISSVSLSRTCLGFGQLMCIVEEFKADAAFPQGTMINSTPQLLDVVLTNSKSDEAGDI